MIKKFRIKSAPRPFLEIKERLRLPDVRNTSQIIEERQLVRLTIEEGQAYLSLERTFPQDILDINRVPEQPDQLDQFSGLNIPDPEGGSINSIPGARPIEELAYEAQYREYVTTNFQYSETEYTSYERYSDKTNPYTRSNPYIEVTPRYNFFDRELEQRTSSRDIDIIRSIDNFSLRLASEIGNQVFSYDDRNLFIDSEFSSDSNSIMSTQFEEPFGVDILLSNTLTGAFGGFLKKLDAYEYFMRTISTTFTKEIEIESQDELTKVREAPIDLVISSLLAEQFNSSFSTTNYEKFTKFGNETYRRFFSALLERFLGTIRKKMPSVEDIILGAPVYSELIGYRIEKSTKFGEQNIYIPNTSNEEDLRYFDNQVRYGEENSYRFYSYVLANTAEYKIVPRGEAGFEGLLELGKIPVDVIITPKIRLFEIPVVRDDDITVVDSPPPPPEVRVYNKPQQDSRVYFALTPQANSVIEKPIMVDRGEVNLYSMYYKAFDLPEGSEIEFSGDDSITRYIIYRLDRRPKKYTDFSSGERFTILTTVPDNNGSIKFANMKPVREMPQELDKTYYYIIRSQDVHDNISNPTPIYELKVRRDGELYILDRKIFDIENISGAETSKSFLRFLRIKPNINQHLINEEASGLDGSKTSKEYSLKDVRLGRGVDNVWGKKYMIKVKSKSTGREVRMKVRFKYRSERE